MESTSFDRLVRALSSGSSRRLLLGRFGGGLVPLLSLALADDVAAKKKRKKKHKKHKKPCSPACTGAKVCKHGTCVCPSGTEACGGECLNACGEGRARNPQTCTCCNLNLGHCFGDGACCSGFCIVGGAGLCAGRGPGDACTFDAQCGSGNCNGFCGA
jgi:hypothetical protein